MNARANKRWLYTLLGVVFLLAIGYQIWFSINAIQYRRHYDIEAGWPFGLNFDTDRFSYTAPALKELGVQVGNELVELEGRPYEGLAQIAHVLAAKRPGERLEIKVLRKGHKEAESSSVPLTPPRGWGNLSVVGWIVFCGMTILTPTFCLLLGFAVAFIRPRDPLAWLLLALMLSFAPISTGSDLLFAVVLQWPPLITPAAIFYHTLLGNRWALWILLFGIY